MLPLLSPTFSTTNRSTYLALLILDRGSAKANLTLADFNPALLTKF